MFGKKGEHTPSLRELFLAVDVSGMINRMQANLKKNLQSLEETIKEPEIESGPLPKSQETYDLEEIFRYIMNGGTIIQNKSKPNLIQIKTSEGLKEFNIEDIIKNANLTHINLTEIDSQMYEKYTRYISKVKGMVPGKFKSTPPESYFRKNDKIGDLKNLSYAEMIAINIYTSPFYKQMNKLLRGSFDFANTQELQDALVHTIMTSSGLNKVSDTKVNSTIRVENDPFFAGYYNRIAQARKGGGITLEQGFISTSTEKVKFSVNAPIKIAFNNVVGKNVSAISAFPKEKEFLMPPMQVSWKHHAKEGNEDFFIATPVVTPQGLSERALTVAKNLEGIELNRKKQLVESMLKQVSNIKADYDFHGKRIYNNPIRKKQIAELALKANELLDDKNMPLEQKMHEISKVLHKIHHSIEHEKRLGFGLFSTKSRLSKSIEAITSQISVYGIKKISKIAEDLNENYFSKPYSNKSYMMDWEYRYPGGKVERPNHGLAHTVRCVAYVPLVVDALKNHYQSGQFDPKYTTSEAIEKIQIASMFYVVGRKNEMGFSDNQTTYLSFREDSAKAFREYLDTHPDVKTKFSQDEIDEYQHMILKGGDPEIVHPISTIMNLCHGLDLNRCYTDKAMKRIYSGFDVLFGNDVSNKLFKYADHCIRNTGDRLLSSHSGKPKKYDPTIFPKCSQDFNFLTKKINEVKVPDLSPKKKHNI